MRKKFLAWIMATVSAVACFSACSETSDGGKGGIVNGDIPAIIAQQAHEEKSGYKFCGYFEDAKFTKRVKNSFSSVPSGYYAKYQLDKTQARTYSDTYEYTPMTIEQMIYAEDYSDAALRYAFYTHFSATRLQDASSNMGMSLLLGKDFERIDFYQGAKQKNRVYNFHDDMEFKQQVVTSTGRAETTFTYDTKWKAYLGETKTQDGIRYYTVSGQYAVVVGLNVDECAENLVIPSSLDGRPVRQVSICDGDYEREWKIKSITVPSSVENAMIYLLDADHMGVLEKIEFAEGVQSIQVASGQMEDIVIPSTAYYVDLSRPKTYGYNQPMEMLYAKDQTITVNGGEHYYTQDGLLYSTEGDLVFQFGNREKLNLQLNDRVKRVLCGSINGLAKNIYIPQNVEYFDIAFNEYSIRHREMMYSSIFNKTSPIFYIDSQAVLEQWTAEYLKQDIFGNFPLLKQYNYVIFGENIDAAKIVNGEIGKGLTAEQKEKFLAYSASEKMEIEGNTIIMYENLPMYVLDEKIYVPTWIMNENEELEEVWIETPYSYLTEDFDKSQIADSAVLGYYEYHNSQNE